MHFAALNVRIYGVNIVALEYPDGRGNDTVVGAPSEAGLTG